MSVHFISKEFTAKEAQAILRALAGGQEKIGLALLNYYARTNLVPTSGKSLNRGRRKYTYSDLILLCWLFRMKREGLPVNRFRRGLDYLRKKLPKLFKDPTDMVLLTDGKQLFLKHRISEKGEIAEALTGAKAGQYVWAYAIGSLIEEVDRLIGEESNSLSSHSSPSPSPSSHSSPQVSSQLSHQSLNQQSHLGPQVKLVVG